MRSSLLTGSAALLFALAFPAQPAFAGSCESLASLALPNTTITLANLVDAGAFVAFPAGRGAAGPPPAR